MIEWLFPTLWCMGLLRGAGPREMGAVLVRHRKKAKLSMEDMAKALGQSVTQVHRLETGKRRTTEVEIIHYLVKCGLEVPAGAELMDEFRDAMDDRGYWLFPEDQWLPDSLRGIIFHEAAANRSMNYQPELIPGLLQTEAYIRALAARRGMSEEQCAARLETRTERQRILFRKNPAGFVFYIQERALRPGMASTLVMADQLLSMVLLADQRHIVIRVVMEAAQIAIGGPFQLLAFDNAPTLAYLDTPVGGMFLEDKAHVEDCRSLNRLLAASALGKEESRMLIATLADEYDRAEGSRDDTWQVAQEQL